jgi:hypothetical protein
MFDELGYPVVWVEIYCPDCGELIWAGFVEID